MNTASTRYPGTQPFEASQESIFFGRSKDIEQLHRLIKIESMVVLYSKSGLGKSSLLNAGILPRIQEERKFEPIRIRFNAFLEKHSDFTPVQTTRLLIDRNYPTQKDAVFPQLDATDESIWQAVKSRQMAEGNAKNLLLIFDQFEELFTYPQDQINAFADSLAEALLDVLPQRYWNALSKTGSSAHDLEVLEKPIALKVVFSVRSDHLHLLNNLKRFLPAILKNCYQLGPLGYIEAEEAILLPALAIGNFDCPPFTYDRNALNKIIGFLSQYQTYGIESTQLQIVCQSIENKVQQKNLSVVTIQDVGDIESMIENYYDEKIDALTYSEQRNAARMLIEDGLIFAEEKRRLSLYERQIYHTYHLSEETLRLLVNSHLLRAEPGLESGFTYELSHDTLIEPILKSREKRLKQEQEKADLLQLQQRELELELERKKRRKARNLAIIMTILAAFAVMFGIIAALQYSKAALKEQEAIQSKQEAESARETADEAIRKIISEKIEKINNQIRLDENAGFAVSVAKNRKLLDQIQQMEQDRRPPSEILELIISNLK